MRTRLAGPAVLAAVLICSLAAASQAQQRTAPAAAPGAQQPEEDPSTGTGGKSLTEINRELNNPVADLWSLSFQQNVTYLKGRPSGSSQMQYTLNFQPVLPVHLGDHWNLINRTVLPLVNASPVFFPGEGWGRRQGFGDIALVSLLSPNNESKFIWGVGPTFIFPTASPRILGQQKYQAGPAAVGLYMSKKWVAGALAQQWWSFAGNDDAHDTNQMNVQYFIWRLLPNRWQVGMSPNVLIDYKAPGENKLTFPVGLGVGKTVKLGKLPVKFTLEGQYMPAHPDAFGQRWNIRLQIIPVIPSLL